MSSFIKCMSFSIFSRPMLSIPNRSRQFSTFTCPLFFRNTQPLCAEPMKKKKRVDPQLAKQRDDRRKKKIEKEIKRLKKQSLQLKPIEEMEIPSELIEKKEIRERPKATHSEEIIESRNNLIVQWTYYRTKQAQKDYKLVDKLMFSQQKALDELRLESEELYQEAIQIDHNLIPFNAQGPVVTPPIESYDPPDGDYKNVTRDFEKEHIERKATIEAILNKNRKPHLRKK